MSPIVFGAGLVQPLCFPTWELCAVILLGVLRCRQLVRWMKGGSQDSFDAAGHYYYYKHPHCLLTTLILRSHMKNPKSHIEE